MPLDRAQSKRYRSVGAQLAGYILARSGELPEQGVLHGVVADLAASHEELIVPLKTLVSRPGFRALIVHAGSGKGDLQRQSLLQELTATFSSQVISAISELLEGFLALPEGSSPAASESRQGSGGSAEFAGAGQEVIPQQLPRTDPRQAANQQAERTTVADGSSLGVLVLAAMAAALFGVAGMVVLRSPRFCGYLGLCQTPSISTASQQALDAASSAEQGLRDATTLQSYRNAVERLEKELLKLSGDSLTQQQEKRRLELQSAASDARQTLRQEETDLKRLNRAVATLDQAEQLSGEEQAAQIASARQELDGIPPRSFSAPEAGRLRERITALLGEPSSADNEDGSHSQQSGENSTGRQPQPSWSPPEPVPRPPSRPAAPSGPSGSAPYRDQPLF